MAHAATSATVVIGLAVLLGPALLADVPKDTSAAFDKYIAVTDARVQTEVTDPQRFLWMDFLPDERRREIQKRTITGEVVLEKLETRDRGARIPIPGGIVHHWVGTVFVPNGRLKDAVLLMQDYTRHGQVFAPDISAGRLISREGDTFTFTMRFVLRKVITAVLQTEQQAQFFAPAPDRVHSRIRSTRIVEIDNAGTPQEHERPAERDRGYLWRQASYWRYFERDGGTYVQCESMSLSRPLPTAVGWFFNRSAAAVPRDVLSHSLIAARRELTRPAR
jgi:hypothetical protein